MEFALKKVSENIYKGSVKNSCKHTTGCPQRLGI